MSPVIVALDVDSLTAAKAMASELAPQVGGFKVGLQLLVAEGATAVSEIAALGPPVFADAKLHDIPNTVKNAATTLSRSGARWVTVHSSGGLEMMGAAVEGMAMGSRGREAGVLAVTVLTSLSEDDLSLVGIRRGMGGQVERRSRLAAEAGVEGLVCAPGDIVMARRGAPGLIVFTPGVRPPGGDHGDQKRVATPVEALRAGADYLVIGRPVIAAPDPVIALTEIIAAINDAMVATTPDVIERHEDEEP